MSEPASAQKLAIFGRVAEQQNLQSRLGLQPRRQNLAIGGEQLLDPHDRLPRHLLVGRALQRKPIALILPDDTVVAANRHPDADPPSGPLRSGPDCGTARSASPGPRAARAADAFQRLDDLAIDRVDDQRHRLAGRLVDFDELDLRRPL